MSGKWDDPKYRAAWKRAWRKRNGARIRKQEAAYRKKIGKEKLRAKWREWYRNRRHLARAHKLKTKYGISRSDYSALYKKQKGRCAVCGAKPHRKRQSFDVDHDHRTKRVRGLLCHRCNPALGLFKDNPKLLRKAAAYLEAL
jgi:hypothetical protein